MTVSDDAPRQLADMVLQTGVLTRGREFAEMAGDGLMTYAKTFQFPDGALHTDTEHLDDLWAVVASPVAAKLVEQYCRYLAAGAAGEAAGEAQTLQAALVDPSIRFEANDHPDDNDSFFQSHRAYLSGTRISILVDAEFQVVDSDFDWQSDVPTRFERTDVSVIDALVQAARDH